MFHFSPHSLFCDNLRPPPPSGIFRCRAPSRSGPCRKRSRLCPDPGSAVVFARLDERIRPSLVRKFVREGSFQPLNSRFTLEPHGLRLLLGRTPWILLVLRTFVSPAQDPFLPHLFSPDMLFFTSPFSSGRATFFLLSAHEDPPPILSSPDPGLLPGKAPFRFKRYPARRFPLFSVFTAASLIFWPENLIYRLGNPPFFLDRDIPIGGQRNFYTRFA